MAFCVVCPIPREPVKHEIKMTLYTNKEVFSKDLNSNTVEVVESNEPKLFGKIEALAWPVTDGPCPNACVVGHMRGTCVKVDRSGDNKALWHYSMGLVFEDARFKGSTLALSGTSGIDGEWSIVGGTGQLTAATGTLKRREVENVGDTRVSELKIHAYYTPM